ncbi:hypothetical protein [Actinoallomurus sp. CA-150999]
MGVGRIGVVAARVGARTAANRTDARRHGVVVATASGHAAAERTGQSGW